MLNAVQFISGHAQEFGVGFCHLDDELYFVDDSLPARLPTRPKFEIFKSVISTLTINVMHRFLVGQRSAQMFRHYVTVFEHFRPVAKMQANVTSGMQVPFGVDRTPRAPFPAAFFAAKFLAFIVARMPTVQRLHETSFFGFATQSALKSRSGFLVHGEQLLDSFAAVKGAI
jgi:hypothetical protein